MKKSCVWLCLITLFFTFAAPLEGGANPAGAVLFTEINRTYDEYNNSSFETVSNSTHKKIKGMSDERFDSLGGDPLWPAPGSALTIVPNPISGDSADKVVRIAKDTEWKSMANGSVNQYGKQFPVTGVKSVVSFNFMLSGDLIDNTDRPFRLLIQTRPEPAAAAKDFVLAKIQRDDAAGKNTISFNTKKSTSAELEQDKWYNITLLCDMTGEKDSRYIRFLLNGVEKARFNGREDLTETKNVNTDIFVGLVLQPGCTSGIESVMYYDNYRVYEAAGDKASVTLSSPIAGTTYMGGAAIKLDVKTYSGKSLDAIERVEYYDGKQKIAESDIAPYTCYYTPGKAGTHKLTAKMYTEKGEIFASEAVAVTSENIFTENILASFDEYDGAVPEDWTVSGARPVTVDDIHNKSIQINSAAGQVTYNSTVDSGYVKISGEYYIDEGIITETQGAYTVRDNNIDNTIIGGITGTSAGEVRLFQIFDKTLQIFTNKSKNRRNPILAMESGRWYKIDIITQLKEEGQGYIQCYIDGRKVMDMKLSEMYKDEEETGPSAIDRLSGVIFAQLGTSDGLLTLDNLSVSTLKMDYEPVFYSDGEIITSGREVKNGEISASVDCEDDDECKLILAVHDRETGVLTDMVIGTADGTERKAWAKLELENGGNLSDKKITAMVWKDWNALMPLGMSELKTGIEDVWESSGFTAADGAMITDEEYAYLCFDETEPARNVNAMEVELSAVGEDMRLELWANSIDPLAGTKLGTLWIEDTGSVKNYKLQSAGIDRTYGNHRMYLRFLGNGKIGIKSFRLYDDSFCVDLTKSAETKGIKKVNGALTDLNYGDSIKYDGISFGEGYDTIELEMLDARDGDMIEVYLEDAVTNLDGENMDLKAAILETKAGDENGRSVAKASIVKCRDVQNVILKPMTDVAGSITAIRFTNATATAEIHLEAESAETAVSVESCSDFNETLQTAPLKDGDVLKFGQVRLGEGYNFLDVRIRTCNDTPENAYLEIRMDGEDGKLLGIVRQNPVPGAGAYDIQSCELVNAKGVHDLYVKAVGDIGWQMNWLKLKCQGYYDKPFVELEAEEAIAHNGTVTDPNDVNRFKDNTPEQESSGRRNVKLTEKDSYIDFKVPEWFDGGENVTITVRNSIPDAFDENDFSVGQTGEMELYVNGERRKAVMPYDLSDTRDTLQLSSECCYGYRSVPGAPGLQHKHMEIASIFFDDASCVIEGEVKAGDVIRLKPCIDDRINFCYVDLIDLEKMQESKKKPENFLSIEECGAVSNDGKDDADALRKAVELVNESPEKWAGVWIPDGLWEMKTFQANHLGQKAVLIAADGVRMKGAGMWQSRIKVDNCVEATVNNWVLDGGMNTMLWDFAFIGSTKTRDWQYGVSSIALGSNGLKYGLNIKNVWMEHWNAAVWGMHTIGVVTEMRIKNIWADGINVLAKLGAKTDGATVERNYIRCSADDSIASFAPCPPDASPYENNVEYYKVRYNTTALTYWGSCISLWGTEHSVVENNYIHDPVFIAGLALQTTVGPHASRWIDDLTVKGNRVVRCGGRGNGHDNGAISIVAMWQSDDYNTKLKNAYIEHNDFYDNPLEIVYIYAGNIYDDVMPELSYNHIRNVGLAAPGNEILNKYDTKTVKGGIEYRYNILESNVSKYLYSRTEEKMEDLYIGNYPKNWKD